MAQEAMAPNTAQVGDTRLNLAQEIIEISYPPETREPMFAAVGRQMEAQMLQSLKSSMKIDDEALAIIQGWQADVSEETDAALRRHIPNIMDGWARSFAAIFSEEELRDILAFVSTDTGKAFMLKSVDVVAHEHFAKANQQFMDETMAIVTGKIPQLMDELIANQSNGDEATE
ncbi:hypothetical protein [Altererythrobacter sp. GH1-8]|uniref:hypothetical protein n=1 Tax=Altererythrobacter sp. GH1-8 TaxID=3349333 RepID=UPI00374D74E4